MDTYVVRIYRRQADKPEIITGIAENIGAGTKKTFRNIDELRHILCEAESDLKQCAGKSAEE